ncbi:MAG: hypothetical protein AAFP08_08650 [Bacteroidota bacterium]
MDHINNDPEWIAGRNELILAIHHVQSEPSLLYFMQYFLDYEDITQDFFLNKIVINDLDKLKSLISKPMSYWNVMRKNHRMDEYRKQSSYLKTQELILESDSASEHPEILTKLEFAELSHHIIMRLYHSGKEKAAKIITLLLKGLSIQEICSELPGTESANKRAITRAKNEFRRIFGTLQYSWNL